MDTLTFAVIHSLQKEIGPNMGEVELRDGVLDVSNPLVVKLAEKLSKLVGVDGSSILWGQFGDDRREGLFPQAVQAITDTITERSFMAMTRTAMDELKKTINGINFATGGYVCFLVYTSNASKFLFVAMIKERGALALTPDMEPTEINEIDLSKLHQAARINLDRYCELLATIESPNADDLEDGPVEKTYLCFANKASDGEVADYFIKALGCEKGISSSRATKALVKAVKNYVRSVSQIKMAADAAKQRVVEYLMDQRDGSTVHIDQAIAAARRSVGPELDRHFDGMKQFMSEDLQGVSHEFPVNHKALTPYVRIRGVGNGWKISFENRLLGARDSPIVYNKSERTLTFTELPPATISAVEQELNARSTFQEVASPSKVKR